MRAERDEILGEAAEVQERLRAAADAVTGASPAVEQQRRAARRARQAREWARAQWSDLQERVERRPYSASAWALGIGFIAGILLTSMVWPRRD
jgi:hypothetical protein